jgi:hypothetical protein
MTDIGVRKLAEILAARAGLGLPAIVEPMGGGRNNRVFRVVAGSQAVVMKCYHHDPNDQRDRLQTEWGFLSHVTACGVHNVPRPLACDASHYAALYSFVAGRRPIAVDDDLVRQAAAFAAAINRAPCEPAALAPASEACFSIGDHLATVDQRVRRLQDLDISAPDAEQALDLVENRLLPAWTRTKLAIEKHVVGRGVSLTSTIPREIISPSDFGFHNALIGPDARVSFLDFEYAGRDDPAKLICDFFCQPALLVPLHLYADFTDRLKAALALSEDELWRAQLLLDAYRIKWVCIMLNEFSSMGARRRAFAASSATAAEQLRSSERYLDLIAT